MNLEQYVPTLVASLSLFAVACGGSSDSGRDMTAGACNTGGLVSSTKVTPAGDDGPAPAFTGGTVVDGAYVLTAVTNYQLADGGTNTVGAIQPLSELLVISNGTAETTSDDGGTVVGTIASYTTSGTTYSLDYTCPDNGTAEYQYTATSTTLVFGTPQGPYTRVTVFTKQ